MYFFIFKISLHLHNNQFLLRGEDEEDDDEDLHKDDNVCRWSGAYDINTDTDDADDKDDDKYDDDGGDGD